MIERAKEGVAAAGLQNRQIFLRVAAAEEAPIPCNFASVVIANGLLRFCPDREAIYRNCFRILKPGGLLVVADYVLSDRPSVDSGGLSGNGAELSFVPLTPPPPQGGARGEGENHALNSAALGLSGRWDGELEEIVPAEVHAGILRRMSFCYVHVAEELLSEEELARAILLDPALAPFPSGGADGFSGRLARAMITGMRPHSGC